MIITLLVAASAAGFTSFGHTVIAKIKERKKKVVALKPQETDFDLRSVLNDAAWAEFKRYLIEECRGWWLAEQSIKEVLSQDHRFTCAQIYELSKLLKNKWPKSKTINDEYINSLTFYLKTVKVEAEKKVSGLILGTDDRVMNAMLKEVPAFEKI